ncbi:myb family transcription factor EFM-like isoform X2 [Prosopis cineraria]|uniref:myb family transcription factor EFM-like isoform X2 n=1 Tax=Prosopis cineraria TaxID=364024 RepID=UPI0024107D9D|nr:myb family transcription factor EFM-like isoform X2 [Prosopis cineraria]
MAAVPSELSLDCKLHHSFSMLLMKSFPDHHTDQTHHNRKLEEFVSRLQEERLKIDAFKRELPLCMQLLTNAMEESRQKLEALRGNEDKKSAVLEDFIPLRNSNSESSEKASSTCDKANWMISAQLWSQANEETKPQYSTIASPNHKGQSVHDQIAGLTFNVSPNKLHKNISGGAFLPFSNERISSNQCPSSTPLQALPELALTTSPDGKQIMEDEKLYSQTENSSKGGRSSNNGGVVSDQRKRIITVLCEVKTTSKTASTTSTTQSHRKARRCWSPDLHRRFVNALQMLGGSQVATPKQIRELMKVDGLTNDEVKSHLQKYRLHTRRPGQQSQAGGAVTPQLVVLGGIWVPPPTGTTNALFSSHPVPHEPPQPYFPSAAPPHDSYTITTLQSHNHTFHHHYHHHNLNGTKRRRRA